MNSNIDFKAILKKAIEDANHPFCDEQDFRIAVVETLKKALKSEEPLIITEYKYNNKKNRTSRIDIYVLVNNKEYVIELKYRPNCTKSNKSIRDGIIKLQNNNRGISIEWQIDKLNNHKTEISVQDKKDDYAGIITWKRNNQEKKYYIMTQNTAYECVDDINKLQDYIESINNKATAYAVVLSDQNWPIINKHVDLEKAQKNSKQVCLHHINTKKSISVDQELFLIDKNTPHQGYWLEIAEIKHN